MVSEEVILSIIVPVYKVEKYIQRCLKSIVNQSLKNIEIIVVNDGSPDNSEEIIKELMQKDSRIIYLKKENGGLSDARNFGLKEAKGKYIGFVDSDDYIDAQMYEKMLEKGEKENCDMVICGFKSIYENGYLREEFNYETGSLLEILKCSFAWNKIYRKEIFEKSKIEFPLNKHYEDMFVIPKLSIISKKIGIIKETLYFYILREGSITTKRDNPGMIDFLEACISNYKYLIETKKMELYEKEWEAYRNTIKKTFNSFVDNYSIDYKIKNYKKISSCYQKLKIDNNFDKIRFLLSLFFPKYYIKKFFIKFSLKGEKSGT